MSKLEKFPIGNIFNFELDSALICSNWTSLLIFINFSIFPPDLSQEIFDESKFSNKLSLKHSNFFENDSNIRADLIENFLKIIQKKVEEKHNISLERELQIIWIKKVLRILIF